MSSTEFKGFIRLQKERTIKNSFQFNQSCSLKTLILLLLQCNLENGKEETGTGMSVLFINVLGVH